MSAQTVIRAAAAKQAKLEEAVLNASQRKWAHIRATEQKASRLESLEADAVANRTAVLLGDEPAVSMPDAQELEELRADVAIGNPVKQELEAQEEALRARSVLAENEYKDAVGEYLQQTAVEPALTEWHAALGKLREAAVKLMASHHLAYRKFSSNVEPANNALELYGPAAELIWRLRQTPWPDYPYSIRPDWLSMHGGFWPDEMDGVAAHDQTLRKQIEEMAA